MCVLFLACMHTFIIAIMANIVLFIISRIKRMSLFRSILSILYTGRSNGLMPTNDDTFLSASINVVPWDR